MGKTGSYHSVINNIADIDDERAERHRSGNFDNLISEDLVALRRRRIDKLRTGEAEALPFVMKPEIQKSEYRAERNAQNCNSGSVRINCAEHILLVTNSYAKNRCNTIDIVVCIAAFASCNKNPCCNKTEAELYNRLNNLRNAGGSHILESLVIAAERGHHAAENNARGDCKHTYVVFGRIDHP